MSYRYVLLIKREHEVVFSTPWENRYADRGLIRRLAVDNERIFNAITSVGRGCGLRFVVFSDIHSNLEGLKAVLEEAERLGFDNLLCCGDIVGYNAEPGECVELVREKKVRCIRGNHERGLKELEDGIEPNMNPAAMEALYFTRDNLSEEYRGWLVNLPDYLTIEDSFLLFHGSPADPDEYIFDSFEAAYAFKSLTNDYAAPANLFCFIGHTHVCAAYAFDLERLRVGEGKVGNGISFPIDPGAHYMFNVGSCGQYRGGSPIATLTLLDTEKMELEFRFLEYDYERTQEKITAAGLPPFLADRLSMGQ
jgi:predicted phosphodiesterase